MPFQRLSNWIKNRRVKTAKLKTGGYQIQRSGISRSLINLPPLTHAIIDQMMLDDEVGLAVETRSGPMFGVEWAFKKGNKWVPGCRAQKKEVGEFVLRQINRLWSLYLHRVVDAQVRGWMAGEITHRMTRFGLLEFDHLEARSAEDVRLLKQDGEPVGVRFLKIAGET
ncbi:MAG: hypothetical protein AAFN70_14660, partial [Planctomycetota bacterium]